MNLISHPIFELCSLMFLAGLLTAHLPWRRRNRRVKELIDEVADLQFKNKQLNDALEGAPTKEAYTKLQVNLDERESELERERAERSAGEAALRQYERELNELKQQASDAFASDAQQAVDEKPGESLQRKEELERLSVAIENQSDMTNQYQEQCADLRRQLRESNAEYKAAVHERDNARNSLGEERCYRESAEASLREMEQELISVRHELAELHSQHKDEVSELQRQLQQQKLLSKQLTKERDAAAAVLDREQNAREGIQLLANRRRREIERLESEVADIRADREHQMAELEQRLRDREATVAQLQRDKACLKSETAKESAARQSAEEAHQETVAENQRLAREIDKADALLEERLYLARKLGDRDTQLKDLQIEYELVQRELTNLEGIVASSDKETTTDRIRQILGRIAPQDPSVQEPVKRCA